MHQVMERVSRVLVVVFLTLACVVESATINRRLPSAAESLFKPTFSTSNSLRMREAGDGRAGALSVHNHSGQRPANSAASEGNSHQGVPSGNWVSGDVSLVLTSGSGSGLASDTCKRSADPAGAPARDLPARAICPFEFKPDASENRIPPIMQFAHPLSSDDSCIDPNSADKMAKQGTCNMVVYAMKVQVNDGESWRDEFIDVPVARVCALARS